MKTTSVVAAALLLAACGGEERVVQIEDFHERSELVACDVLGDATSALGSAVSVHSASDSTFIVVDPMSSQVALLNGDAEVVTAVEFEAEGPRGVAGMLDAALSGDSLLVVTDRRNRLRAFDLAGNDLWTVQLDFPAQGLVFAGDRLLVSALGMDPRIPGLLHELRGGRLVPLGVPFVSNPDALARGLANAVAMQGFDDGSAIVAHEFITPRALRLSAEGGIEEVAIPVPDEVVARIGFVPPMPIDEDDLSLMVAPVLAMSADPTAGDVYFLTRSGRKVDGHSEKSIVRLDSELEYLGSVRLGINAVRLAYLPSRPGSLIVVDTDLQWHRCPVPARSTST